MWRKVEEDQNIFTLQQDALYSLEIHVVVFPVSALLQLLF
jgi:hypothetical protein